MASPSAKSDLKAADIHDVLSNERRQLALKIVREEDGHITLRQLADEIAAAEADESTLARDLRQSAYVSLHQTHLPKLDDLGIIEYDEQAKAVELTEGADDIGVYMETVQKYGLAWSEYYTSVSLIGLLLIIAGEIGVPVLVEIGSLVMATVTLLLIVVSAIYQTVTQRSSVLHRMGRTPQRWLQPTHRK